MSLKSKTQQRFMDHLKEKGKLPSSYECDSEMTPKNMYEGGWVEGDDEDGEWNFSRHNSTGEPGMAKYLQSEKDMPYMAKGGRVDDDYAEPNFAGPSEHDQPDDVMSEQEIKKHMAMSLMKRKQSRPGA
jgi:hypothetical protein